MPKQNKIDGKLVISRLRDEDFHALLRLSHLLHPNDSPLDTSETVLSVWRQVVESNWLHYYGAFLNKSLVAVCHLAVIPNFTKGARPYGIIENVVTDPQFRQLGIATSLLRYTLDKAKETNCYKVMLLTGTKQEWKLSFYEKVGFEKDKKTGFVAYF